MADALEGIRVLDLSTVLAAPVTATLLGDFGATVVKVEEPGRGDFTRTPDGGRSPQWLQEGRNKRSITCNLRTSEGRDLIREVLPQFDVVVTSFRPPTLQAWGLEPKALLELNPRMIVTCVTGFGLTGPYSDRGAFDRIASAFAGLTYVTGQDNDAPVRSGYSVVDFMSAYLAAYATMLALYNRDVNGGSGQIIDLALYEAGFRAAEDSLVKYALSGEVRQRAGNTNPMIVPASDFDTADGRRVSIHAGTDALFRRLAQAMGQPELATDPAFADRPSRVQNADDLYKLIAAWVAGLYAEQVVNDLARIGVPASPIMTIADIAEDPHYWERGTLVRVSDPEFGELPMIAPIPKLSQTPGRIAHLGPALGADNDDFYSTYCGKSASELAALRERGVI